MANITFLEAGGASTGGTELYEVTTGAVSVDTSIKPTGAYSSLKIDSSGGISTTVRANGILGASNRLSAYLRVSSTPVVTSTVAVFRDSSGNGFGRLLLSTSRKLIWQDGAGVGSTPGTTTIPLDSFQRISVSYVINGANNLDVKVYIGGVLELNLTAQNTDGITVGSRLELGDAFGGSLLAYFAHIYVDDGSDLSDPGNIQCTAKFPTSVNVGNFDTTGGTGAVNERPLSITNYMEQAGASQVNQNYNIQGAATGDMDISASTLVGYMGWLWAKESAVSGTPKLTLNGSDYAVTLTTSPAIYRKPITSASYPSDAATIGMVSSGTTDDTFLYECGMVMGFIPATVVNPGRLRTIWLAGK